MKMKQRQFTSSIYSEEMRDKALLLLFQSYILILVWVLLPAFNLAHYSISSKCVLFNFGDSNSDPGALAAALGLYLNPPYGQRHFFNSSTGRFSDGRLYIDFICQELKIGILSPYLESSGSDFSNGVNFAVGGATAAFSQDNPLPLYMQERQFAHFQNRTRELRKLGKGSLISEEEFRNAVYSVDIGGNDVVRALLTNSSYQQFVYKLPIIIQTFQNSIKALHKLGARKFWIYNTPPNGCVPALLATEKKNNSQLDEIGCLTMYNNASKAFNEELSKLCDKLRSELKDATIVYVDMFAIKYDLFANPRKYGFENPLMSCCGYGGPPYNYEEESNCGGPRATACADPGGAVYWDGSHFTEAANAVVASKVMSGEYSKPFYKLKSFCYQHHYC